MNKTIEIGNKKVGAAEPTFIIAEAGSNHNQKLEQAKELIDVAAASGADAVKFQLYRTENLYTEASPLFAIMKANELSRTWIEPLAEYAESKQLMFLASAFDEDSVDLLNKVGVKAFKLASSEAVNLPLLRYAAAKKKPVIIATGMCDLADVHDAVEVVYCSGNNDVILLHCTALYPPRPDQVNLRVLDTLKQAFQLPVGFSDHTLGITMPIAAVAMGACVIEKHFTLSRSLEGPDHSYALEPDELKNMVDAIREVERSFGSPLKQMTQEEKKIGRRTSVIAKVEIPQDTRITQAMVMIDRPGTGIKPRFVDLVIGAITTKNITAGEAITWDTIQ